MASLELRGYFLTPTVSRLRSYLGDLGGLISTAIVGVISAQNLQVTLVTP